MLGMAIGFSGLTTLFLLLAWPIDWSFGCGDNEWGQWALRAVVAVSPFGACGLAAGTIGWWVIKFHGTISTLYGVKSDVYEWWGLLLSRSLLSPALLSLVSLSSFLPFFPLDFDVWLFHFSQWLMVLACTVAPVRPASACGRCFYLTASACGSTFLALLLSLFIYWRRETADEGMPMRMRRPAYSSLCSSVPSLRLSVSLCLSVSLSVCLPEMS